MGCFPVLKSKMKQTTYLKLNNDPKEHSPAALPEPQLLTRSLQSAPPSLKAVYKASNNRMPALSPYSTLDAAEQDALCSVKFDENEDSRYEVSLNEQQQQQSPNPLPLPLPSPQAHSTATLKPVGSFKSLASTGPLYTSGPLPLPPCETLRNFSNDEIVAACRNSSPEGCISEGLSFVTYKASFGDYASGLKKFDATVTRLQISHQSVKEFINDMNTLASLQHPNLCRLLGYHAREGSGQRALVYESLSHGSLDRLLYGRSDGPPIDWNTRIKIALCAAWGLTFLHEEGPFQAMYNEFSASNIQIDKDFSAKLSGYGCGGRVPDAYISNSFTASGSLSVETLERGLFTPKSNVWSFGIILLELLTGRKNLDSRHPKEERNLVKWSRPFLSDDCRLTLIMDPQLKGRFPAKAARAIAEVAKKCLQKDPSGRPTMRTIVNHLKIIQHMKYSCWFPLQEPAAIAGKQMSRPPSLNVLIAPAPRLNFLPSPPTWARPSISPEKLPGPAISTCLPPRSCSSSLSKEELDLPERCKLSSSSALGRTSIEGF